MQIAELCYPRRHSELVWCLLLILIRISNSRCWSTHSLNHSSLEGYRWFLSRVSDSPCGCVGSWASCASWLPNLQASMLAEGSGSGQEVAGRADDQTHLLYNTQGGRCWWERLTQPTWVGRLGNQVSCLTVKRRRWNLVNRTRPGTAPEQHRRPDRQIQVCKVFLLAVWFYSDVRTRSCYNFVIRLTFLSVHGICIHGSWLKLDKIGCVYTGTRRVWFYTRILCDRWNKMHSPLNSTLETNNTLYIN